MQKSSTINSSNSSPSDSSDDKESSADFERQETIKRLKRPLIGTSLFVFKSTNKFRKSIFNMIEHKVFKLLILLLIIVSSIILALEDPLGDPNGERAEILFYLDITATCLFILEAVLKIIAYGFVCNGKSSYLCNGWDILDFIIVLLSSVSIAANSTNIKSFKALRMLRVLRPLRVISRNDGLKLAVKALLMSIPDIINVMIISLLFFLVFGIFSVNYFKGSFHYC